MKAEQVVFPLAPVYRKKRIDFRQARAVALWPEGEGNRTAERSTSNTPSRTGSVSESAWNTTT
jgi:hypothetical protein